VSHLCEAEKRDMQPLPIKARAEGARSGGAAGGSHPRRKLTSVEARYARCRNARYQGYLAVLAWRRQGHTQQAMGEPMSLSPDTVTRWLNAPGFPERRIGSDRRRDREGFLPGLRARLTSVASPAALLGGSRCGPAESATVQPFPSSEEISGSLPALLPGSASATPIPTAFPGDAAVAERHAALGMDPIGWKFPFLAPFGRALLRDRGAGAQSITTPWNLGAVEGHLHRPNLI
jgi:hypothetical protein